MADGLLGVRYRRGGKGGAFRRDRPARDRLGQRPGLQGGPLPRFVKAHRWLAHARTRYRSLQASGVIERFYESITYDHVGIVTPITMHLGDPARPWPRTAEASRHRADAWTEHPEIVAEVPVRVRRGRPGNLSGRRDPGELGW
ncbi:MAG: hypothetical protein M0020_03000 [Actinomycetota bacterium]|nr:hypothetical protein [Actinomycetota bacterium]